MNILLTGASGFIGRNIMASSLASKYNILTPSSAELNCVDEESVDRYFASHDIDIVIHSAVKPTHRNAKSHDALFYSNVRMFCNLERHSSSYQKMLVVGSGAIYDLRNYRSKMEEESYRDNIPADDHGFCKYVCEKIIEKSDNIYDLRVFGIFGKWEDYAIRFISNAICKAINDLPITIRQDRRFDYLDVDDFVNILEIFIENKPKHKSYNITPTRSVNLREAAEMVVDISGKELDICVAQEGLGLEYSGDNSRLLSEFPEIEFTPIRSSIESLYRWYESEQAEGRIDRNLLLVDK